MRLSGARPNRTWNMVVSSSTMARIAEGEHQRLIEGVGFVLDLGGVARDRDEIAAVLAEIDGALDQPQLLVLRPGHIALARCRRSVGDDAAVFEMRQARRPTASARRAPPAWCYPAA